MGVNMGATSLKRLAATIAVGALALTGCGSSSGSKNVSAESKLTGTPFVLGSICSCTGALAASLGRSLDVLEAWGKYVNAHGGLNGHPVKLVTEDDGQNPARGLAAAKKLVEQDHVQAIVGEMSTVDTTWASYVDGKGIPVIGGQPVDATFMTDANFFPSGTTLPVLLFAEIVRAATAGHKTLGVLYCSETPVCAQLPKILEPLGAQAGLKVVSAQVSQSAPSYTAPCLAFKSKGVTALFAGVNSDVVPRVQDSCFAQGYKPQQIASNATTQKSWTTDANLDGSLLANTNATYTDTSIPGIKAFSDALDSYLPDVKKSPQFSSPLLMPWAGGQLFAAAVKAGSLTPTSTGVDITKALQSLKDETLDGIAPPLNFTAGRPAFPTCYFTGVLKDQQFQSENGGKPTCLDAKTVAGLAKAFGG
jgi:branched-chain amino acid transport system substrate-binding protein